MSWYLWESGLPQYAVDGSSLAEELLERGCLLLKPEDVNDAIQAWADRVPGPPGIAPDFITWRQAEVLRLAAEASATAAEAQKLLAGSEAERAELQRLAAEAARDRAEAVPTTTDQLVTGILADSSSGTSQRLSSSVNARLDSIFAAPGPGTVLGKDATGQVTGYDIVQLDKDSLGLGNVTNTSDAQKPVSTAQQDALDAKRPTFPAITTDTQRFICPAGQNIASTNGALGDGTFRALPWFLDRPLRIDRLGAEVTTAGQAGSKVRLGIYADNGHRSIAGAPLLLDAGVIAGDSVGGQTLTINPLLLPAGLYWVGGVVQAAATTQPSMRVVGNAWDPGLHLDLGQSAPSAGIVAIGYSATGISGALPALFPTSISLISTGIRSWVRNAA